MSLKKEIPRIAVIGGGIGGISTAIALLKQLNYENFVIYEKSSDIGGTWYDNTYPGCASDVAGHWYSLSHEVNPNWSSYYVAQPEILAYWRGLVDKFHLRHFLVANTAVVSARWDEPAQVYHLTLRDERTGVEREQIVEVLISAMGAFMSPAFPRDVPGKEDFKGVHFHSSRWRHDVPLSGKKVGVIGNACSAVQFIPRITKDPSVDVTNFARTPHWLVSRGNYFYPGYVKWAFAHIPGVLRIYRNWVATSYDIRYAAFRSDNASLRGPAQKLMTKYITHTAPKDFVDRLIPNYPPGCKRIVVDPGYLDALHRPNMHLTWDAIDKIVPEGILTKKGDLIPLDVIIFATGFDIETFQLKLSGSGGRKLTDYFDSKGGATAYLGTTVPGFPNFFMIMGPNTVTGHASVIYSEEVQINYAMQLIKPILSRKARSFSVRDAPTDAYNAKIQQRIAGSVFTACASYYRSTASGKNVAIFPGPLVQFWWWLLSPRWADYQAVGAEKWERERKLARMLKTVATLLSTVSIVGLTQHQVRVMVASFIRDVLGKLRVSPAFLPRS